MGQDHATAAVALELEFVESISVAFHGNFQLCSVILAVIDVPFTIVPAQEVKVGIPFVADNLAAREAANRNNLDVKCKFYMVYSVREVQAYHSEQLDRGWWRSREK